MKSLYYESFRDMCSLYAIHEEHRNKPLKILNKDIRNKENKEDSEQSLWIGDAAFGL